MSEGERASEWQSIRVDFIFNGIEFQMTMCALITEILALTITPLS